MNPAATLATILATLGHTQARGELDHPPYDGPEPEPRHVSDREADAICGREEDRSERGRW